jgi:hypothetical protein
MKTAKPKKKVVNEYPEGWDEARVRRVLEYYENQTEEEAAAEIASATPGCTLMDVPHKLVPIVRQLITELEHDRRGRK